MWQEQRKEGEQKTFRKIALFFSLEVNVFSYPQRRLYGSRRHPRHRRAARWLHAGRDGSRPERWCAFGSGEAKGGGRYSDPHAQRDGMIPAPLSKTFQSRQFTQIMFADHRGRKSKDANAGYSRAKEKKKSNLQGTKVPIKPRGFLSKAAFQPV